MNLGDTFYSLIDNIPCYSARDLRDGKKNIVKELDVDTLNNSYGFDDAQTAFLFNIPKQKLVCVAEERVVCLGVEYVISHLKCTHYDDGHDGFLGIASSPSIDRDFTVELGFETKDITTTKPQDFKGGAATSENITLGGSVGSNGTTPTKISETKTSTGLIVGLSIFVAALLGGIIYLFNRK